VVSAARAKSGAERREWSYISLAGVRHPMMVSLSALHDGVGRISGWVAVGTPMAGFREMESERARARQLEQQLEVLRRRETEVARLGEACQYVEVSRSLRDALKVIGAHLPLIFTESTPGLLVLRATDGDESSAPRRSDGLADTTELSAFHPVDPAACWALKTGQLFISEPGLLRCRHLATDERAFACVPLSDGARTVAALSAPLVGVVERESTSDAEADPLRERQLAGLKDQARQFSRVLANQRLRLTLEQQATQDALTGAVNRRQLEVDLRLSMRQLEHVGQAYALIMLDVDHFKNINDALGHERGDTVLSGLVRVLRERLRSTDVVARLGGEEFVVLLRDINAADALRVAEKLRLAIAAAALAGPQMPCTCSMGLVHVTQPTLSLESLLRATDQAMYAAKANGRNCVVVGSVPEPPRHE
jgi:diguanylate cyclase (GGDEF)-like protein